MGTVQVSAGLSAALCPIIIGQVTKSGHRESGQKACCAPSYAGVSERMQQVA